MNTLILYASLYGDKAGSLEAGEVQHAAARAQLLRQKLEIR